MQQTPLVCEVRDGGQGKDGGVVQESVDHRQKVAERLNKAFFAASPAGHFRARARLAMQLGDELSASAPPPAGREFTAEVLARLPGWVEETDQPVDGAETEAALTVESFMLAHHAGESLLRHLLAQVDSRGGVPPWRAMAAQQDRSFGFRKRVEQLRDMPEDDLRRLVAWVFLGEREPAVAQSGEDAVAAAESCIGAWVRHFARFHLDTSNGYNASKHGLSSLPSQARISFFPHPGDASGEDAGEQPGEIPLLAGPTLDTLEYEGRIVDRRWYRVTRTVDPAGLLATVLAAADLLDSLWQVGRARHLGVLAEVTLFVSPTVKDVIAEHSERWGALKIPLAVLPLDDADAQLVLDQIGSFRPGPRPPAEATARTFAGESTTDAPATIEPSPQEPPFGPRLRPPQGPS